MPTLPALFDPNELYLLTEPFVLTPVAVLLTTSATTWLLARTTTHRLTAAGWLLGPLLGAGVGAAQLLERPGCSVVCLLGLQVLVKSAALQLVFAVTGVLLGAEAASDPSRRRILGPCAVSALALAFVLEGVRVAWWASLASAPGVWSQAVALAAAAGTIAGITGAVAIAEALRREPFVATLLMGGLAGSAALYCEVATALQRAYP